MTEETPTIEQGTEKIDQELAAAIAETVEEPAPAAETQPAAEPITEAQKWREALSVYSSADEARSHVKELSIANNWNKGTGYRAVGQIKKWKDERTTAKVPTFKINKVNIPAPAVDTGEKQPISQPAPYQPPTQPAQTYTPPASYGLNPDYNSVIERQAGKAINNVLEIIAPRVGINGEDGTKFLDDDDTRDLGIVIPILLKKATGAQMTPEMQENAVLICYVGNLATKGIKNRMLNKPQNIAQQNTPPPAPAPAEETAQPPTQPPAHNTPDDDAKKPEWAKALP